MAIYLKSKGKEFIMRICHQINKHIRGGIVNGSLGKIYNVLSTAKYMKSKIKYLKSVGVNISEKTKYISPDAYFDGHAYNMITIDAGVVISREVMLLTHDYSLGNALCAAGIDFKEGESSTPHIVKNITIGENSFIGARASILPGTTIGKGCIIGACTVVKGNIPDYSIVIGNPAKIVENTIEWVKRKESNA